MSSSAFEYTKKFASELVIKVICKIQKYQQSSLKDIINCLSLAYNVDGMDLLEPVVTALRKGLAFGFLKIIDGNFMIDVNGFNDNTYVYPREPTMRRSNNIKYGKKDKKRGKKRRRHH